MAAIRHRYLPGFVPISTAVDSIKYMALSSAYAGSLAIPLCLILLYCPKGVRKSPVFPTLVLCLLLGITWGVLSLIGSIRNIKDPLGLPTRGLFMGNISFYFLIPVLTDTVLIWKILWLFPKLRYTWYQRLLLVLPPALLTIPRLIVVSLFLSKAGYEFDIRGGAMAASFSLNTSKLAVTEFTMQFASNLYCSTILLLQAYRLASYNPLHVNRSEHLRKRFMSMFRVLASSFLIPVCIQLALIISAARWNMQWTCTPIQWSNVYVSLHCAVLATVWSSIGSASRDGQDKDVISSHSSSFGRLGESKDSYVLRSTPSYKTYSSKLTYDIETSSDAPFSPRTANPGSDERDLYSCKGQSTPPNLALLDLPSPIATSFPERSSRVKVDYTSNTRS